MKAHILPTLSLGALAFAACQVITGVNDYETAPVSSGQGGGGGGTAECADEPTPGGGVSSRAHVNSDFAVVNDIAVDDEGVVYIVGHFTGSLFDGTEGLIAPVSRLRGFLARVDETGSVTWAKLIGDTTEMGSGSQYAYAIAEQQGILYVTGGHTGAFNIGDDHLKYSANPALNTTDIWVAAFASSTGNPIWAKGFGGPGDEATADIIVRESSVVVAGSFSNGVVFNNGNVVSVPDGNGTEGFLLGIHAMTGAVAPVEKIAGPSDDVVSAIAFDDEGRVFALVASVGGIEEPPIEAPISTNTLPNTFVLRYTGSLEFDGAATGLLGDDNNSFAAGLDMAIAGDRVAIVGAFGGTVGGLNVRLSAQSAADGFVVMMDTALTPQWGREFGGGGDNYDPIELLQALLGEGKPKGDGLTEVQFFPDGCRLVVSGTCNGEFLVEDDNAQSCTDQDAVVLRIDGVTGETEWSAFGHGTGDDYATALTLDNDEIVVGGLYQNDMVFDGDIALPPAGGPGTENIFLARIKP